MVRVHVLHVLVLELQLREVTAQLADEGASGQQDGHSLLPEQLVQLFGLRVRQLMSVVPRQSTLAERAGQESLDLRIVVDAERHGRVLTGFPIDVHLYQSKIALYNGECLLGNVSSSTRAFTCFCRPALIFSNQRRFTWCRAASLQSRAEHLDTISCLCCFCGLACIFVGLVFA